MRSLRFVCLLLSLLGCTCAWAVPAAVVDTVQAPAWRVRGETREPLLPGMDVANGDQLATGSGARVYLKLAEGSTVKLGESARLTFYSRSLRPQALFKGALDVLTGAFRFTTAQAAKLRQRELAIRVGTATIGIRGTDVWGKSVEDRDLVMLIEGHIEVKPAGGEALELSDPLSVFVQPRGALPLPLATATPAELATRGAETDLLPQLGALHRGGRAALRLGEALDEAEALARYDRLRAIGYGVKIRPVRAEGGEGWRYEVLLKGFRTSLEAQRAAAAVGQATGLAATPVR